jgi:hypothetical protein
MEGQALQTSNDGARSADAQPRLDLMWLAALLVLAAGLRGWLLFHTEVPARDTIGYIRYALAFESQDWITVLRNNHQHPGYPLSILAVSSPVRILLGESQPQPETMTFCACLASNLAAVLLVIPMYFLGKLIFHRAAGVGAAALFQCLPVSAHILSDGLSEALFLFCAACALAFAALALESRRPWHFVLCGCCCGFAYLTRPEGALLIVATGIVLVLLSWLTRRGLPARQLARCMGGLLLPAIMIGSPYVLATGHLTNKPSAQEILDGNVPAEPAPPQVEASRSHRPLLACSFAFVLDLKQTLGRRAVTALWGMAGELVKCFHYVAWIPAVLGIWWFRRRMVPGLAVLAVLCLILMAVLWRLAVVVGYMSDRHLMLVVLCGCYATAAAVWELPARVAAWLGRRPRTVAAAASYFHSPRTTAVATGVLLALLAVGMPKALEKLHGNRAGFHAAGLWLADHALPADRILDDHCWSHYYAGHVFLEDKAIAPQPGYHPTLYVVIGRREKEIIPTWNRSAAVPESELRSKGGHIVYAWPIWAQPDDAAVVVYAVAAKR